MKPTPHRMFGSQASCLRDLVAILVLVVAASDAVAQEGQPSAAKTPDISGEPTTPQAKQIVERVGPRGTKVVEIELGKTPNTEEITVLNGEVNLVVEGDERQDEIELSADRVVIKGGVEDSSKSKADNSKPELNSKRLFQVERMPPEKVEAAIQQLDVPSNGATFESTSIRALPDTPAARQLVEQLGAQESAAAAEAETIRRLQANGQAEQNRQPIAEHQRKLKNLLSTAFDLKLQLEEIQVKELQSRLSRLERQIGQRKDLREKIIKRRASELIAGDALKWDASDTNPKEGHSELSGATSPIRVIGSEGAIHGDPERCSLASPPEPVEILREFERARGIKHGVVTEVYEKNPQSIRVVVEPIYDRMDPPMNYPLIGTARFHRLRYRCSLTFENADRFQWPTEARLDRNQESTIYIDVDHIHRSDDVAAVQKSANTQESPGASAQLDPLPSPEELRKQLQPFSERVTAAEARVHALEAVYFQDHSNAAQMQQALDALNRARQDCADPASRIRPIFERMGFEYQAADVLLKATEARLEPLMKQISEGTAKESDLKTALDSQQRLGENLNSIKQRYTLYEKAMSDLHGLVPSDDNDPPLVVEPIARDVPHYPDDVAIAWLEAVTGLKLELVRLEGLKGFYKAGLRVRESSGRREAGDLIVVLQNRSFESLDQAVQALTTRGTNFTSRVLVGGLSGKPTPENFDGSHAVKALSPGDLNDAVLEFEVRLRGNEANPARTIYVPGVCVSLEGLFVLPVASKSLVDVDPIVSSGLIKGTGRVLGGDDDHNLTLIKLDSKDQRLFDWLKLDAKVPLVGKRVKYFRIEPNNGSKAIGIAHVESTGHRLPEPFKGDDAFVVNTGTSDTLAHGVTVTTVDGELLGIFVAQEEATESTVDSNRVPPKAKTTARPFLVVPAVHIETLVNDYRKSVSSRKTPTVSHNATATKGDQPKPNFTEGKSLDELLAVLKDDRDHKHVVAALVQIGKMDLGENAGRVVEAILAAMEFHDPIHAPVQGQPPVSYFAEEVLKPLPRSVKVPVIVKTLKDGHPRSKMVALWIYFHEKPVWESAIEPEFPVVAELLFSLTTAQDAMLRVSALSFLVDTLSITKIDPAGLTTEERREGVRRLAAAIPREKVQQLILDALRDQNIDVVLNASRWQSALPEKLKDQEQSTRVTEALTKIVEGTFHDVTATSAQRGQALSQLATLRDQAAPAVPVLIKLLKPGTLEEGGMGTTNPLDERDVSKFTRRKVIALLGAIGPRAKDALPILEEELTLIGKKEREDALLAGQSTSRLPIPNGALDNRTLAGTLSFAIRSIKGISPRPGLGNRGQ